MSGLPSLKSFGGLAGGRWVSYSSELLTFVVRKVPITSEVFWVVWPDCGPPGGGGGIAMGPAIDAFNFFSQSPIVYQHTPRTIRLEPSATEVTPGFSAGV